MKTFWPRLATAYSWKFCQYPFKIFNDCAASFAYRMIRRSIFVSCLADLHYSIQFKDSMLFTDTLMQLNSTLTSQREINNEKKNRKKERNGRGSRQPAASISWNLGLMVKHSNGNDTQVVCMEFVWFKYLWVDVSFCFRNNHMHSQSLCVRQRVMNSFRIILENNLFQLAFLFLQLLRSWLHLEQ